MNDPRKTGISSITGRMVVVRHATDTDRVRVGEYLAEHGKAADLGQSEVVIAAEDERIIGFGILKNEDDAGCISLFEDSRRKGIGSTIIKHLLTYEPLKRVYAARYASYFTRSSFTRAKKTQAERSRLSRSRGDVALLEPLPDAANG